LKPSVSPPTLPDPEQELPPELEDELEEPTRPPALPAKPSKPALHADESNIIRTLTQLFQAAMEQHEAQLTRLQETVAEQTRKLEAQHQEGQALHEMHEEHLATLGDYLERCEDMMAAGIRLIEEHAAKAPQRAQEPEE
jgi:DNA anti-recombination protein RmuC